jgi:hypothetical protein
MTLWVRVVVLGRAGRNRNSSRGWGFHGHFVLEFGGAIHIIVIAITWGLVRSPSIGGMVGVVGVPAVKDSQQILEYSFFGTGSKSGYSGEPSGAESLYCCNALSVDGLR